MKAGNVAYHDVSSLPETIPVFPLSGALLLPGGRLPLNIFEMRYLAMTDYALATDRLIGMVQPRLDSQTSESAEEALPPLSSIGCVGRLVSVSETGDGRYLIALAGICRFRLVEELPTRKPFRLYRIEHFADDLAEDPTAREIDRPTLLETFRAYLDAHGLEADWESVRRAENAALVNALSMMTPYGPAEKQALLEARDVKTRADTLVALTELVLSQGGDGEISLLQ